MKYFSIFMVFLSITSLVVSIQYDVYRVMAYVSMGIALSLVNYIVYYRRLEFLAAESVHISLLAVTAGLILEYYLGFTWLFYSIIIGLVFTYLVLVLMKSGIPVEKASAVVVSLVAALNVITIHYALLNIPLRYSLSGLIIGDPLLLTRSECVIATLFSTTISILVLVYSREIVEVSIDPVAARLSGLRVWFYDILSYTLIGITTIGLLRLAGFIMEHVLILLPAITASMYSRSIREHVFNTVILGTALTSTGYLLSLYFNTAPTGMTGLLLLLFLVIGYIYRRWSR